MSHRSRTTRPLVLAGLVMLLAACGTQPPVQLDVAPAGSVGVTEAVEETEEVAEAEPIDTTRVGRIAVAREPRADVADVADPGPTEAPVVPQAPPTVSTSPEPPPADPELIVGEDGCVTDVATGLVVTCYDPAAGPDED